MTQTKQIKDFDENEVLKDYKVKGLGSNVGFGKEAALLVIDMSYGFTDPDSPLGSEMGAVLDKIRIFLNICRQKNIPIFYTTISYKDPTLADAGKWIKKIPSLLILKDGTRWVEIDNRISPQKNEVVIRKNYASAFFGTDLDEMLREKGIDTIILTGGTTSGCVRATAVDGLQLGYNVIVPVECVGDRSVSAHHCNLIDIQGKYGDVVSVEQVIEYLDS